jgi:hypothetical protein
MEAPSSPAPPERLLLRANNVVSGEGGQTVEKRGQEGEERGGGEHMPVRGREAGE